MNSSVDIQAAYADLFQKMRNYIWDLDVVEMLADVEVDTFDAFIDKEKLQRDYQKLHYIITQEAETQEDEELKDAAEAFNDIIEQSIEDEEPAYLELYKVQEISEKPDLHGREIPEEEGDLGLLEDEDLAEIFGEPEEEEELPEEEFIEEEETE